MKKSKKFLSVLCAVCMILAMAAPAFAAESYPQYIPVEPSGTVTFDQLLASRNTVTRAGELSPKEVYLPTSDQGGTNGVSLCFFTAEEDYFSFAMRLKTGTAGSGTNYNIQLWQINPNGSETKVGSSYTYAFGDGPSWNGKLTIGNEYYVKVSSSTVTAPGATCEYIWSTEEQAYF